MSAVATVQRFGLTRRVRSGISAHRAFELLSLRRQISAGAERLYRASEKYRNSSSELHWIDRERYSNRQQRWTPLGGFVGHVTYRGDLAPFLPYLRLGEYTHVGKGATFGLGQYLLTQEQGERHV